MTFGERSELSALYELLVLKIVVTFLEFFFVFSNKQASSTGTLEFLDIDQDPVAITNKAEHYGMYGLEWDPSGRYCATYNRCLFTKVSVFLIRRIAELSKQFEIY